MRQGGFIQKGQDVSVREIDEMLRQHVEPVQVEVFHYTRRWLMRMAGKQLERPVEQLKTARQLDLPPKLAMPMRVLGSTTAILCQLDAHVPTRRISEELVPGFAHPEEVLAEPSA